MRLTLGRGLRPTRTSTTALLSAVLLLLVSAGTALAQPGNGQGPPEKETICHRPGTPAEQTKEVPSQAVPGHLGHGDEEGACEGGEPPEPLNDAVIDADGTDSRFSGDPEARDVSEGDELSTFPVDNPNDSGLDAFDQDGDGQWTMSDAGEAGDDLHVEGPAFCDTGQRDSVHQEGQDCLVLDTNDDLTTGDQVDCDLEIGADLTGSFDSCPPSDVVYHDANDNGAWDDGEDIVHDSNGNLVFD